MSLFYINPGELRTKVRVQYPVTTGSGTKKVTQWVDIGNTSESDPPRYFYTKWLGLSGSEAWMADSVQAVGASTVTMRYTQVINEQCRIVKDGVNYQIVNVDDPTQHKRWLVIKTKVAVNG